MSTKHASIIPVPVSGDDKVVQDVQRWILQMVEQLRFEEVAAEAIPRCRLIMDLKLREKVLQFAVDWLLHCGEFGLVRTLLKGYPIKPYDEQATVWLCTLHLYVAKKTRARTDLLALQQFVREYEQALGGAASVDLFLAVAVLTRDLADIARVIKYIDAREDDNDLPLLLGIVRITQDPEDVRRLCERCRLARDQGKATTVLCLLELLLAKFPKGQAEELLALLPNEGARSRTLRLHKLYQQN